MSTRNHPRPTRRYPIKRLPRDLEFTALVLRALMPGADYSANRDDTLTHRAERAAQWLANGPPDAVLATEHPSVFIVKSWTQPVDRYASDMLGTTAHHRAYTVALPDTCECPDWRSRGYCSHLIAAAMAWAFTQQAKREKAAEETREKAPGGKVERIPLAPEIEELIAGFVTR